MNFSINKVLPEEAYEYAACHIACWQSAYKGIVPDGYLENMQKEIEQRAERTKKNLAESPDSFYCAKLENRIVGVLIFSKSRDEDKPDAGEVGAIYLLAEFWGKGYGRQMMDFAIETLKNAGYHEIILWVLEENHRARRFYEKYGFIFDGTKKEIILGKSLTEVRYMLGV